MKRMMAVAIGVVLSGAAYAQSPYKGMEARSVKALSDQQISDLQAGRGMGLALAAELNGYPGPMHVLELAAKLGLSKEQKQQIERQFQSMKAEAVTLGNKLITQEAALDKQFASRAITATELAKLTAEIGATHAELRNTHLKYHLETAQVLTPQQTKKYAELRGYAGNKRHGHGHGHGSGHGHGHGRHAH